MRFHGIVLLAFFATATTAFRNGLPSGDVAGTVTDSTAGQPLHTAEVAASRAGQIVARAITDNFGRYRIHDLPNGDYTLTVSFPGLQRWEATATSRGSASPADDDPFALRLPTLLLANKADRSSDIDADLQVFRELTGLRHPMLAVSATTGRGLGEIGPRLFGHLGIVRIYTKAPGHPPDKGRPFTLRRGQTVGDVARLVHKDLERSLRYARVWGHSGFEGQQVGHEHVLVDGDIVELHA